MFFSRKYFFFILSLLLVFSCAFFYHKSSTVLDYYTEKMKIRGNYQNQGDSLRNFDKLWSRFKVVGQELIYGNNTAELPKCPKIPPDLGPLNVVIHSNITIMQIVLQNPNVQVGGHSKPKHCKPRQKIAIIIPYRNRETHLKIWLYYMHPFMQKQEGHYGIYVVEQSNETTFNRAKLMNIGFAEVIKEYDYDCFIFSDVDIIPMDQRNLYRCSKNPRHMANSVDKFNFRLPYTTIFGGIVAFTKDQFLKVNGFSNVFWGWGGEDDEMYSRVVAAGMKIDRPEQTIARSRMIVHRRDPGNEKTGRSDHLINKAHLRMQKDGLNTLNYTVISFTVHKLYTKITVDIGSKENDFP